MRASFKDELVVACVSGACACVVLGVVLAAQATPPIWLALFGQYALVPQPPNVPQPQRKRHRPFQKW